MDIWIRQLPPERVRTFRRQLAKKLPGKGKLLFMRNGSPEVRDGCNVVRVNVSAYSFPEVELYQALRKRDLVVRMAPSFDVPNGDY